MNEQTPLVVKEEITLDKYEDGVLVERITAIDGKIVNRELFTSGGDE